MAKKKKKKASNIFWRIVITLVGIALIIIAVSSFLLFLFGKSTQADVNVRRFGGANDGRPYDQRYEWSVDYTFYDNEGVLREGHTQKRGSDLSVDVDETVYYFPAFPYLNSLKSEAKPNWAQLLYVALGAFLIWVVNSKKKKKKAKFNVVKRVNGELDVPDLTDYDDSVEEVFHEQEDE